MIQWIRQHKGIAGMAVANGGVAISVLFGAFQFFASYEQTQADVMYLHEAMGQVVRHEELDDLYMRMDEVMNITTDLQVVISRLETRMDQADQDRYKLDELDDRLDRLDDFVIRWDEQSNMIMSEHEQFSEIIKEVWEAIDARGTVPAGTSRTYGYD
jgi:DNA repair ATPase RecN